MVDLEFNLEVQLILQNLERTGVPALAARVGWW